MENNQMMSVKTLLFLSLCFPLNVYAQQYSEQSLKTLFTSQQERQAIESARKGNNSTNGQMSASPASVQINGIVKRSNGESVVWVNGINTIDSSIAGGIKVYPNSIKTNNKVPVMLDGKKLYIKPGETWSEDAGISDVGK